MSRFCRGTKFFDQIFSAREVCVLTNCTIATCKNIPVVIANIQSTALNSVPKATPTNAPRIEAIYVKLITRNTNWIGIPAVCRTIKWPKIYFGSIHHSSKFFFITIQLNDTEQLINIKYRIEIFSVIWSSIFHITSKTLDVSRISLFHFNFVF